jgi:hypothetical protein
MSVCRLLDEEFFKDKQTYDWPTIPMFDEGCGSLAALGASKPTSGSAPFPF